MNSLEEKYPFEVNGHKEVHKDTKLTSIFSLHIFGYQFCFIRELIDLSVIHFWNRNKHPCICVQNPHNFHQVILYFS
jgi:hypothetical protein